MEFKRFRDRLIDNLNTELRDVDTLYVTGTEKDVLWNTYLENFPEGTNPIFRERTEHDCSCCRHFVKSFGNVVYIKDGEVKSIWDFDADSTTYSPVVSALSEYVKSKPIVDVFVTVDKKFGTESNLEYNEGNSVEWNHFYYNLDKRFVTNLRGDTLDGVKGRLRDTRNVFARSLTEISLDAINTVLELISQNSLYRGEEWKGALTEFKSYKTKFEKLNAKQKELYAWSNFNKAGTAISKIKNHSIGVLLMDISEGMDLDKAVKRYENIVAPANYKRPKPIFTKKMVEDAQKKIKELGFENSLKRRYANIDDVTVNNIRFVDRDTSSKIEDSEDVFEQLKGKVKTVPKNLDRVEEITIEKFISDVLPTTTNLEVLFENRHKANLMSLIAPINKESKPMFKWNNNFSWAYTGNTADSMKEQVKSLGGKVDGVMRFSIRWNDGKIHNENDLDAHCDLPDGDTIYYMRSFSSRTSGKLDVDIQLPNNNIPAIENIAFPSKDRLIEGDYVFYVNCFNYRGGDDGFSAEIEVDGEVYEFNYPNIMRGKEKVKVATVNYSKKNGFKVTTHLDSSKSQVNVWGCVTNTFVPVNIMMMSPNYWDGQDGIGNKHYFFMMKDCVNPETPNAFYNEFLNNELTPHRKVLEALGSQLKVQETDEQLSGVGFSSTIHNSIVCRVTGHTTRILEVVF